MKIALLSRSPDCYSSRRIVEAGESVGHEMVVLDYLRCRMDIAAGDPAVFYMGERVKVDAIIPRIAASYTFYGAAVVRQFEMGGVLTANSAIGISQSRDKLRCHQLLSRKGVDMPVTGFAHDIRDIDTLLESVGGTPAILKLLEGSQGKGVVLAETRRSAESIIAAFRKLDANFLVQEYIEEAGGCDIRALVVGKTVVGAMMRTAEEGEFRANLHQGGKAVVLKLTKEEKALALHATQSVGLKVAGVDLIRSSRGPLVLEVNSSPGLEGVENTTGKDIAGKIIRFLEKKAPITA
ncbi:MAG: 30S ribosomal protein S6--L-glutamate ligase [Phycisphaerales bacterium]|jgi:ribosomal protein S6--L-glutamate ligase|nr:30S ribosomal protein S6--L-glutamate ligase [Phycisphaerales bacterium]